MMFSARTRYLLVSAAVMIASLIELVRGYRFAIVAICGITFLCVGNAVVYLSGSKERAARREAKRVYYAGEA